jgi:redox-sensing transcriptional repressor
MTEHNQDQGDDAAPGGREPLRAPEAQEKIARIPKAVIKRLSLYTRVLQQLEWANVEKVSSQELAEQLGLNSAQVRKDLAYFGQFGVPGLGYYVGELRQNLKRILRTDRSVRVVIVGVGNLGSALMSYGGFMRQGVKFEMAFDNDPSKIGTTWNNIAIHHVDNLERYLGRAGADIAILSVPADAAQGLVDRLVKCGVAGILNFVPKRLIVPPGVKVHYVDLAIEIESLSYYLK